MEKNFGSIAITDFKILALETRVPTVFYNCGPGYTYGKSASNTAAETTSNARVYFFEKEDGTRFESGLDGDWSSGYIDSVVLKLGGGSVHTTNLQGSTVMFDMAANGQKVHAGWITPDHTFLVRNRNRNDMIDNSSERFYPLHTQRGLYQSRSTENQWITALTADRTLSRK